MKKIQLFSLAACALFVPLLAYAASNPSTKEFPLVIEYANARATILFTVNLPIVSLYDIRDTAADILGINPEYLILQLYNNTSLNEQIATDPSWIVDFTKRNKSIARIDPAAPAWVHTKVNNYFKNRTDTALAEAKMEQDRTSSAPQTAHHTSSSSSSTAPQRTSSSSTTSPLSPASPPTFKDVKVEWNILKNGIKTKASPAQKKELETLIKALEDKLRTLNLF